MRRCGAARSPARSSSIAEFGDPARDRRFYEMRFSTLRDRDGKRIGAYQFVYDVTERLRDQERLREAEAALRQAQKMESLGQLTGGVAHDFNNLLAVFASGLQLLERDAPPRPARRVFEAMRRAVARGTGLTRHLLAFSRRAPQSRVDRHRHPSEGMRAMLDARAGRRHRASRRIAAEGLWPVEVDAGELELAILNLCVNARDAMPAGGMITVAAATCKPGGGDGGAGTTSCSCRSATPAAACRRTCWRARSSRSSRPRTSARARASACRRSTASRSSPAARSTSSSEVGDGHHRDAVAAPFAARAGRGAGPWPSPRPLRSDAERRGQSCSWKTTGKSSALTREMLASSASRSRTSPSADAALARCQRPHDRRCDVRHHDAWRLQRTGAGAGSGAASRGCRSF